MQDCSSTWRLWEDSFGYDIKRKEGYVWMDNTVQVEEETERQHIETGRERKLQRAWTIIDIKPGLNTRNRGIWGHIAAWSRSGAISKETGSQLRDFFCVQETRALSILVSKQKYIRNTFLHHSSSPLDQLARPWILASSTGQTQETCATKPPAHLYHLTLPAWFRIKMA